MRQTPRPHFVSTRRRGLTLVECLIATVVLAFTAAAAATALSASYQQQKAADERAEASLLGERLIAEIAVKPYAPAEPLSSPEPSGGGGLLGGLIGGVLDRVVIAGIALLGIEVDDAEADVRNATNANTLHGMADVVTGPSGKQYARRISIETLPDLGASTALVTVEVVTPGGDVFTTRRLLVPEIQ